MSRYYNEAGEVVCDEHPDAPHGFNRNASHNEGRYVCDCEYWVPEENVVYLLMCDDYVCKVYKHKKDAEDKLAEFNNQRWPSDMYIDERNLE